MLYSRFKIWLERTESRWAIPALLSMQSVLFQGKAQHRSNRSNHNIKICLKILSLWKFLL